MKKIQTLKTRTFKNKRLSYDSNQMNYDSKWETFSRNYRKNNPWCVECRRQGIWNDSKIQVDHIIPLEQAPDKKYDLSNLQSLCCSCHSKKTHREKLSDLAKSEQIQNIKNNLKIKRKNQYDQ